jgi:hypothetical protein
LIVEPSLEEDFRAAFDRYLASHSHSVGMIRLFLTLVLCSAVGFRGVASVLRHVAFLFPTDEQPVSPNGGQMWLLRLGLYELSRPKELANDWVWILDHTIQVGRAKCLVIVGVRLDAWNAKRSLDKATGALTHQDLSVWMIEPVEKSDGPTVQRQLEELSQRTGIVPRSLLSDCGADLSNGIARFCDEHPQTIPVHDIAHASANALKRELNEDPQWVAFQAEASRCKARVRQTKFAFLMPPELKHKARWMNLDPLLDWSRHALRFLATPRPVPGVSWEADELETQLGWVRNYQEPVKAWSNMLEVAAIALKDCRLHGYHAQAAAKLEARLTPFIDGEETPASRMALRILAFVKQQSEQISEGQHLLASSEVLESLIGKAKQLEGQHSKSGFTKMILGLAASVSKLTEATITKALDTIKVKNVLTWIKDQLGTSVQGQRHHAFARPEPETKPG